MSDDTINCVRAVFKALGEENTNKLYADVASTIEMGGKSADEARGITGPLVLSAVTKVGQEGRFSGLDSNHLLERVGQAVQAEINENGLPDPFPTHAPSQLQRLANALEQMAVKPEVSPPLNPHESIGSQTAALAQRFAREAATKGDRNP